MSEPSMIMNTPLRLTFAQLLFDLSVASPNSFKTLVVTGLVLFFLTNTLVFEPRKLGGPSMSIRHRPLDRFSSTSWKVREVVNFGNGDCGPLANPGRVGAFVTMLAAGSGGS